MTAHPTLQTAICLSIEKALNAALRYDPATALKLKKQAGRCISLSLTDPTFDITLYFTDSAIEASPIANTDADCHLSGKAGGLIKLLNGPKKSLAGSDLRLSGHTGFLMELLDIAKTVDVDWEGFIADMIAKLSNQTVGDQVGHGLATLIRKRGHQAKRLASRSPAFLHDFFVEELRITPSKIELEHFYQQVDKTHQATERLQARLGYLKQQHTKQQ